MNTELQTAEHIYIIMFNLQPHMRSLHLHTLQFAAWIPVAACWENSALRRFDVEECKVLLQNTSVSFTVRCSHFLPCCVWTSESLAKCLMMNASWNCYYSNWKQSGSVQNAA